jgi:anthranilate phosphoribosyltransferase
MKEVITKLVDGKNLSRAESKATMKAIMSGESSPAQIGSFLTALRIKGETVEEISEFAKVMREFASSIHPKIRGTLVDTCGTGGDTINTFNISTVAALVAAGAGVPIAKHGNRSVTSQSGSADVLEALDVRIDLSPEKVEKIIEKVGIGFMFAPLFHGAMKHAIGPRREIGIRTVFNILGPLTNPANAEAQLLGVFDEALPETLAGVLRDLDIKRALVVHGLVGLDEISNLGETKISELNNKKIESYIVSPEDFGLTRAHHKDILGGDAKYNAELARRILRGEEGGPRQDIVELNAGASIYVGGKARSIKDGLEVARQAIKSGEAHDKLLALSVETRVEA